MQLSIHPPSICELIFTRRCPPTSSEATELTTDVLEIPESLLATEDAFETRNIKTKLENASKEKNFTHKNHSEV